MIHILAYIGCLSGIILGLNHQYFIFFCLLLVLVMVMFSRFQLVNQYLRFPVCVFIIAFLFASLCTYPVIGSICEGVVDHEITGGQVVSVASCETGGGVQGEVTVFCRTYDCAQLYTKQKVVVENEKLGRLSGRYIAQSEIQSRIKRTPVYNVLWFGKLGRDRLYNSFLSISSPEIASLGVSVLFGQTNVSAELSGKLKELGIIHIMAVSGINIAYLMNFVSWFSRHWRRRWRDSFNVVILLLLNCMVGPSVSLVRATLTFGQNMVRRVIGVRHEQNGIFTVLSVMLILSPRLINNYSYLLVSAACLGIYWVTPRVLFAVKEGIVKELLTSLVVWGTVLPVQWCLFKNLSWWGGLLTFVLSPLVESMTVVGYLSVLPSLLVPRFGVLYLVLVSIFTHVVREVSRLTGMVDRSS